MQERLVKVELGCGPNKQKGYIGIDRFALPGVDIVADLDKEIPLESDSVDVLFASHSLEHLQDLNFTMSEIYRVCKHKAIINIIAPYYNQSSNIANLYHKIPFNEHTFRYFTTDAEIPLDKYQQYLEIPSLGSRWGLSESDHSISVNNFKLLNQELIFYPEYNHLDEETKLALLQSSSNVCFMITYSLTVWKDTQPFSKDEFNKLQQYANDLFKDYNTFNTLKKYWQQDNSNRKSVYDILNNNIHQANQVTDKKLTDLLDKYNNELHEQIQQNAEKLSDQVNDLKSIVSSHIYEYIQKSEKIANKFNILKNAQIFNDLINNSKSFNAYLRDNFAEYYDGLLLYSHSYSNKSAFSLSDYVNIEEVSYSIKKSKNDLAIGFFIHTIEPAVLIVETVSSNKILSHEHKTINESGVHYINIHNKPDKFTIRFNTLNNTTSVRLLQIYTNKNPELAYFIY